MSKRILVTGGAGFIGSHTVDALLARGDHVRILDNLDPQVHHGSMPKHVPADAEFLVGDLRDPDVVHDALKSMDTVIHCASAVGVGQSQYEIKYYTDVNVQGTAHLLEQMQKASNVSKLVCCSSMSCYGEGAYVCPTHGLLADATRTKERLIAHEWEVLCPDCKSIAQPVGIRESHVCQPRSMYALSKKMQEDMIMNAADTYGFDAIGLRFFNVYGSRQSLRNPYTGVVAIFLARLLQRKPALIFEDGQQLRDFVAVEDVVKALLLSVDSTNHVDRIFNVGTGTPVSILQILEAVAQGTGCDVRPQILERYRIGDIRHCFADSSRIANQLGWSASLSPLTGIARLCSGTLSSDQDSVEEAMEVLREKRLLV